MPPEDTDLQDPFANNQPEDEISENDYEAEEAQSSRFSLNRRFLLIGLVFILLICLVGILIYRVMTENGGDEVAVETPIPGPTEALPTVVATVEEEPTPSPTRVIAEEPAEEPADQPAAAPTATPPPGPSPTPTPAIPPTPLSQPTSAADLSLPVRAKPAPPENLLANGDFEEGFNDQGVGLNWQSFTNGGAIVSFSGEVPGPYVKSGDSAQRISIAQASEPDRYGGIYQQVEVSPSQPYTLEVHGQIRSSFGDIQASSYGYRMQYAIDQSGGENWRQLPAEAWVELPWDEQLLGSPDVKFLAYTTVITPTTAQVTLIVRGWNKWSDLGLAEYTLDSLSLIGPSTAPPLLAAEEGPDDGDALIPVTGENGPANLLSDGRFWGAVLILLLLAGGAMYRRGWGY